MSALTTFWRERAPRERAVLAALGGVVALALAFLLLVEPAWLGIKRLQSSLPSLRAQVAQLEQGVRWIRHQAPSPWLASPLAGTGACPAPR